MLCGEFAFRSDPSRVVDVNDILAFGSRRMSLRHGGSLLSRPRNKRYLYIGLSLFGTDLLLNLKTSNGLANFVVTDWP
jgi:hypothetical protein